MLRPITTELSFDFNLNSVQAFELSGAIENSIKKIEI
jgi:acyl carrier protein